MNPKPTRDWVINELERLGIRVVSGGRTSRKGEDDGILASTVAQGSHPNMVFMGMGANAQTNGQAGMQQAMMQNVWNQQETQNSLKQARRSSSLGLSLLSNDFGKTSSFGSSTQPSINNAGIDLIGKPAFRELVGGGAAAAYNAYRDDFYRQQPSEQGNGSNTNAENSNGVGNASVPSINLSNSTATNPNEHYQMLKLHHMNLLNEIQETTLMMNIYQQQHLQQQQLLLQQHQNMASLQDGGNQMNMLLAMQQNVGGIASLQQIEKNGVNLRQTHVIPSEPLNEVLKQDQHAQDALADREKRLVQEDSNDNSAKRQKLEGDVVASYVV
ncbi:hypothetical protein FisN_12Hh255 [Fistulifera solaris]|uniref:Uncharacterized protein n=1 Tax=Fistulifera solaris TaxID=1519565 RepID=A0A1Z5KC56_FISSO|nr:hypothetical protein FisN_12Hh255 [Fistulifera solaris]|eukprot:GAX23681.1 hypothetical protein FisN_12Hh255 [Fistulifera solaris]